MKSILITGAASGIGAATVKKLASKRVCFTKFKLFAVFLQEFYRMDL